MGNYSPKGCNCDHRFSAMHLHAYQGKQFRMQEASGTVLASSTHVELRSSTQIRAAITDTQSSVCLQPGLRGKRACARSYRHYCRSGGDGRYSRHLDSNSTLSEQKQQDRQSSALPVRLAVHALPV